MYHTLQTRELDGEAKGDFWIYPIDGRTTMSTSVRSGRLAG